MVLVATFVAVRIVKYHKNGGMIRMGKEMFCDICRKSVPLESALNVIKIGDDEIGEACLNCAAQLKQGLKSQMAEVAATFNAARLATVQPVVSQQAIPEDNSGMTQAQAEAIEKSKGV